jgi:ribonuclease HI
MSVTAAAPDSFVVYCDGACRANGQGAGGSGGWGALIERPDGTIVAELHGGERPTTNNRMELMSAIEALKALPTGSVVVVWTDSQYVQKGMSEWIAGWKRRGWKKSDGGPVLNAGLWRELDTLASARRVTWKWIRGHAGHRGNERADALANLGVDEALRADSATGG